ncbi:hypothetical protein SNEBB_002189 [Seison nebaliae]|nr:hypothetical protein SNEBB_002189 [Seison nebaliae]
MTTNLDNYQNTYADSQIIAGVSINDRTTQTDEIEFPIIKNINDEYNQITSLTKKLHKQIKNDYEVINLKFEKDLTDARDMIYEEFKDKLQHRKSEEEKKFRLLQKAYQHQLNNELAMLHSEYEKKIANLIVENANSLENNRDDYKIKYFSLLTKMEEVEVEKKHEKRKIDEMKIKLQKEAKEALESMTEELVEKEETLKKKDDQIDELYRKIRKINKVMLDLNDKYEEEMNNRNTIDEKMKKLEEEKSELINKLNNFDKVIKESSSDQVKLTKGLRDKIEKLEEEVGELQRKEEDHKGMIRILKNKLKTRSTSQMSMNTLNEKARSSTDDYGTTAASSLNYHSKVEIVENTKIPVSEDKLAENRHNLETQPEIAEKPEEEIKKNVQSMNVKEEKEKNKNDPKENSQNKKQQFEEPNSRVEKNKEKIAERDLATKTKMKDQRMIASASTRRTTSSKSSGSGNLTLKIELLEEQLKELERKLTESTTINSILSRKNEILINITKKLKEEMYERHHILNNFHEYSTPIQPKL